MNDLSKLVEARILSIAFSEDQQSVQIRLVDRETNYWSIQANGLDDFLATDIRGINVIDRVIFYNQDASVSRETSERLFYLMRGRYPSDEDVDWTPLKKKIEALTCGELIYLEIEAAYGAEVMFLAKTVRIEIEKTSATTPHSPIPTPMEYPSPSTCASPAKPSTAKPDCITTTSATTGLKPAANSLG